MQTTRIQCIPTQLFHTSYIARGFVEHRFPSECAHTYIRSQKGVATGTPSNILTDPIGDDYEKKNNV